MCGALPVTPPSRLTLMERLLAWIRDNPQLAAVGFVLVVLAGVLGVLAILMQRSGLSLRPIVWFAGFFAIVAGPQAVVHLLDGYVQRSARSDAGRVGAPAAPAEPAPADLAPVSWATVFGPDADPALTVDAKIGLAQVVGDADEAKIAFNARGESALAARFASPAAARRALDRYGTFFAFAQAAGSDAAGWTARRHQGQGEWVHVVTAGAELYAWTAADRETVRANRVRALGPIPSGAEAAVADKGRQPGPELVSQRLTRQTGLMLTIVALNLVAAGLWFFKGSAWAARIDAPAVALPADVTTLRQALLAVNQMPGPVEVAARPDGALEVNWRYADARWFDLMRVHRLKRTHRLVLFLDTAARTVRVREYWSAFDASAGPDGLRLGWKAATGIQFFAVEHQRVFGAQLGPDGRPTGEMTKAYTFNLQELKAPLLAAVTGAGWRWQPLTWNTPESLRWLTE